MTFAGVPPRPGGIVVLVLVALFGARDPNAQTPAPGRPPTEKPRIQPPPPPTPEDVAAWERLWPGGSVKPDPPPSAAAPPASPAGAAAKPEVRTRFDDLYRAYADGDTTIIGREIRSSADFERVRPELVSTLARWRGEWSRGHAAFALDIALAAFAQNWPDPGRFLAAARDIVTNRPDPPGVRPDDDAFERRFHEAAVALLTALNAPRDVELYLDSIAGRFPTSPAAMSPDRLVSPRLILGRAMAREMLTAPLVLAAAVHDEKARRTWVAAPGDGEARRRLRSVLEILDLAVKFEETRDEALVRRAFILHRLGDQSAALAAVNAAAPTGPADRIVDTWRALVEGRVLSALDRPSEAIAAFERAATLAPQAQTPAVALARTYLRLGDRELAEDWATRGRSTPPGRVDPWSLYWSGDLRFLPGWLDELRKSLP
jgi:tetratricopeptide (TPR) repeat protein